MKCDNDFFSFQSTIVTIPFFPFANYITMSSNKKVPASNEQHRKQVVFFKNCSLKTIGRPDQIDTVIGIKNFKQMILSWIILLSIVI